MIKYCEIIILIKSYFQLICSIDNGMLSLNDIVENEQCQGSTELNQEGLDIENVSCLTVDICFESPNDGKTFYHQYVIKNGFGIMTKTSKKGTNNKLRYFILVCSRHVKYVSTIPVEKQTQPTQAYECLVRIHQNRG